MARNERENKTRKISQDNGEENTSNT